MLCLVAEIRSFVKKYKIDIGKYDLETKEYFPDLSSKEINAYTFNKIIIVLFGKK